MGDLELDLLLDLGGHLPGASSYMNFIIAPFALHNSNDKVI
jgi:hypothetical protein